MTFFGLEVNACSAVDEYVDRVRSKLSVASVAAVFGSMKVMVLKRAGADVLVVIARPVVPPFYIFGLIGVGLGIAFKWPLGFFLGVALCAFHVVELPHLWRWIVKRGLRRSGYVGPVKHLSSDDVFEMVMHS